jgi:eukaryotic-like serine/threonine-protein kinase
MRPVADFQGTERFEVRRNLGHGGMGVVYEAFDRERNTRVALKTLLRVDGNSIFRLKQEFRSLTEVFHPNIVQLHELFFAGGTWFFTMELVEGRHFLKHLRPTTRVDSHYTVEEAQLTGELTQAAIHEIPDRAPPEPASVDQPTLPASATETLAGIPEVGQTKTEHRLSQPSLPRTAPTLNPSTHVPRGAPLVRLAPLDVPRLRRLLAQLVESLVALHGYGVLHRDIKPSNVMVTTDERVVLLDFGLATRQRKGDSLQVRVEEGTSGTPAYMAPEQVTSLGVTEASDWYSVGAMLYEALTGSLPITGTPMEIVARKLYADPPPPQSIAPDVPGDLADLCMRMLHREPEQRPTGEEILRALGLDARARVSSQLSSTNAFVGRRAELASMREILARVCAGGSARIHLQALSGLGKSALAQRFLTEVVRRDEAVVLIGQCYQRESVPHKAIDSSIDSICDYLQTLPDEEAQSLMPRDIEILARMFPSLQRVDAVAQAPRRDRSVLDLQELRQLGFGALKQLLQRIASRKPLVLFIDDLQWGDLDSASALAELQGAPAPPSLLILLAYRANELAENAVLRELLVTDRLASAVEVETVELHPLDAEESTELAKLLVLPKAPADRAVVDTMLEEAQGSPFFVGQIAQYLESGGSLHGVHLEDILAVRVEALPEPARELLRIVATAGAPIPFAVAVTAAEPGTGPAGTPPADAAFGVLSASRFVQSRQSVKGTVLECYHDRLREFVVESLDPQTLRESHRRIAQALEQHDPSDVDALTLHWHGADDAAKTVHYARIAAKQAMGALAFDRAAELYRTMLDCDVLEPEQVREVRVQLGDALQYAGSCVDAARTYLTAVEGSSPQQQLELRRRAAEQFMISGYYEDGRKTARKVLESVSVWWPRSTVRALVSLFYNRGRLKLRGVRFRPSSVDAISDRVRARLDAVWAMVMGLSMVDIVRGAGFTTRGLLYALDVGEPRHICMLMTAQAGHALLEGNRPDGLRLLDAAEQLAQTVDDSTAHGNIAMVRAASYVYQGKWKQAREQAESAERFLREECLGTSWQSSNMHLASSIASFYLGDFHELARRVPQREQEAKDRGNIYSVCALRAQFGVVAWLARDDVAAAREKVRTTASLLPSDSFHLQHLWVLLGDCLVDQYEGAGDRAWERYRAQRAQLLRSFVLQVELFRFMATVHLAAGCALAATTTPKHLRAAKRAAKKIARFPIEGAEPIAKLVRASVAAKAGQTAMAARLLEPIIEEFRAADMMLYAAAAQRRLGELREDTSLVDDADAIFRDHGASNPERATAMLAPGFAP